VALVGPAVKRSSKGAEGPNKANLVRLLPPFELDFAALETSQIRYALPGEG